MPNRLINETSPYLLQHAHNPVDWYPWGEEAFRRAREEDKALLVSIGYSACHWCHVMERESFENEEIAGVMNELFVNIKVDREERPDLDQVYMAAVQTLTGRGGWPLNVFITPEGKPFFGGSYFPPEDLNGMPGLPRVLRSVAQAYRQRRDELSRASEQLQRQLLTSTAPGATVEPLTEDILKKAFRRLQKDFDFENGGFGTAPKFPHTMALEFLLRYYQRTRQSAALQMVELALTRMARGGIRDQLGGGFHRYSTDAYWLVPHFEKMLYDNALMARLYLHAYQSTSKEFYRLVAEDTLDYVAREMMSPEGGFYSAQDADTQGVEGKYYVWSHEEIAGVLGQREAEIFNRYCGVTPGGNFEGKNVLSQVEDEETLASGPGLTKQQLEESIAGSRKRLLEVRGRRTRPGRDDKVLAAWNGLMLSAFAEAANILGRKDYRDIARASADFLLRALKPRPASGIFDERDIRQGKGLMRSHKDGKTTVPGYLEDYANLIDGLLAVHEATFDLRYLTEARSLADTMIEEFWDEDGKVFYDTGRRHERLFLRPREVSDHVTPSGSSNAAQVLLRLAIVTGNREYSQLAVSGLRSARSLMLDYPAGAGNWLGALDFYLATPREIAIVGPREHPGTEALVAAIYRRFMPNRVLVAVDPAALSRPAGTEGIPLLEGRGMVGGRPTAYVCENFACREPVTTPEGLAEQLGMG